MCVCDNYDNYDDILYTNIIASAILECVLRGYPTTGISGNLPKIV